MRPARVLQLCGLACALVVVFKAWSVPELARKLAALSTFCP